MALVPKFGGRSTRFTPAADDMALRLQLRYL